MAGLFPNAPIPLEAQVACVERELGFRRSVYRRRVSERKMSQEKADQEIAAMEAVLATLRSISAPRSAPLPEKPF